MIPKLDSNELNEILEKSNKKIVNIEEKINTIKTEMEKKLKIINYENRYVQESIDKIKSGAYSSTDLIQLRKASVGKSEIYGSTVYAKKTKEPLNVFNISTSALNKMYFREDVKVYINDIANDDYLSILKHDSISKPAFFEEFTKDIITIRIELSDLAMILGPTRFNAIEIEPFLYGSFDIVDTRIFMFSESGKVNENVLPKNIEKMQSVGTQMIVLPEKTNFYKIEFDIKINFETWKNGSKIYPFGLKHIYFYDMDFDTNSYVVATINSEEYISYIKNEIRIKTPFGDKNSTITESEIELYLDMDKTTNTLSTPIEASLGDNIKEISRNVKSIYAKIPIKAQSSIIGIEFNLRKRVN